MKILLIAPDHGNFINNFPIGLAYIASAVRNDHEVKIYHQDVYHYPPEHLTALIDEWQPGVVACGCIAGYYQHKKLVEISKAIHQANHKACFILGGHGPSSAPEYFLRKMHAEYVVHGEGQETFKELVQILEWHKEQNIFHRQYMGFGISCIIGNKLFTSQPREQVKDVSSIPYPAYDLFPMDYYALARQPGFTSSDRVASMVSGWGCPFKCNFCARIIKGFRPRSSESIVEEIQFLQKNYHITAIEFLDELLMSSPKRTTELCNAFLDANLNVKWVCNGRLNYATKEVLALMKKAGCTFINYGIESVDDNALKLMNKNLTVAQIILGVENTIEASLIPGLNIIWGNLGEGKEQIRKDVEFLKKYGSIGEKRTIRPVCPYPGTDLYKEAIKRGLLKDEADFFSKSVNSDLFVCNFMEINDEEAYQELKAANIELVSDFYLKEKSKMIDDCIRLYDNKNVNFRGFRPG